MRQGAVTKHGQRSRQEDEKQMKWWKKKKWRQRNKRQDHLTVDTMAIFWRQCKWKKFPKASRHRMCIVYIWNKQLLHDVSTEPKVNVITHHKRHGKSWSSAVMLATLCRTILSRGKEAGHHVLPFSTPTPFPPTSRPGYLANVWSRPWTSLLPFVSEFVSRSRVKTWIDIEPKWKLK